MALRTGGPPGSGVMVTIPSMVHHAPCTMHHGAPCTRQHGAPGTKVSQGCAPGEAVNWQQVPQPSGAKLFLRLTDFYGNKVWAIYFHITFWMSQKVSFSYVFAGAAYP